ncbi:MAG: putative Serine/threonine-protein kinase Nek3, partial [Streblomastix strix]
EDAVITIATAIVSDRPKPSAKLSSDVSLMKYTVGSISHVIGKPVPGYQSLEQFPVNVDADAQKLRQPPPVEIKILPKDDKLGSVTKGEIVHVIKKEIEFYTIEKNSQIGKVPMEQSKYGNETKATDKISDTELKTTDNLADSVYASYSKKTQQSQQSLHSRSKSGNETKATDKISDSLQSFSSIQSVISVNTSASSWYNLLFEIPRYEDFDIIKKLSGGAMGKTFLVQLKLTGKQYVMKRVDYLEDNDKKRAYLEATIMQKLSSRYTVRLIWAFEDREELFMITDYCELGDLRKVIKDLQLLSEEERLNRVWDLFAQIIKAVDIMHSLGIIHRDIKPANIFIMEDGTARLGDFGLAKDISVESFAAVAGTLNYQAAEVWTMRKMNLSSDVFAVGVCIYELITGENPFSAQSQQEMIEKIQKGDINPFPQWVPIELKYIITAMLNPV